MSTELDINGVHYSIGKLNARQQYHIVRRLAPILQGMIPIWQYMQVNPDTPPIQYAIQATTVLLNSINQISDEDTDYVLDACLAAVRFQSPGGSWAPLKAGNGSGNLMLEQADDLATQLRLVWEVLYYNTRGFSLGTLLPFQIEETATPGMVTRPSN